jgi:hypothetical protein
MLSVGKLIVKTLEVLFVFVLWSNFVQFRPCFLDSQDIEEMMEVITKYSLNSLRENE